MSYVLFIDDSRIEELGITGFGGLLVTEEQYAVLKDGLRELKRSFGIDPHAPIKWSPPADDPLFEAQRTIDRHSLRSAVCGLIGSASATVMVTVIDEEKRRVTREVRRSYLKRSLEFLCQRTELELQALNSTAMIVAELPGGGDEGALCRHYAAIREGGSNYPNFSLALSHLDREMRLSHDYLSPGIQLADCAIGATCAAIKGRSDIYVRMFRERFRRHPASNSVKGYGVVVYPSNSNVADTLCQLCDGPVGT